MKNNKAKPGKTIKKLGKKLSSKSIPKLFGKRRCRFCHKFFNVKYINTHIVCCHRGSAKPVKKSMRKPHRIKPNLLLGSLIDKGTFGKVYKGVLIKHKNTIDVAIKKVESVSEFRSEMKIIKCIIGCKGVVFYHLDACMLSEKIITMDYMPLTLSKFLAKQKGVIGFATIQTIMKGILQALQSIHSYGIIHRDIKPNNILMNKSLDVKLCDFGWSIVDMGFRESAKACVDYYRAPEIAILERASKYNTKIDLWAAGAILMEMVLKRPLFQLTTTATLFSDMALSWKKPSIKSLNRLLRNHKSTRENIIQQIAELPTNDFKYYFNQYAAEEAAALEKIADSLLEWDPSQRLSAKEALEADFFLAKAT